MSEVTYDEDLADIVQVIQEELGIENIEEGDLEDILTLFEERGYKIVKS